MADIPDRFAWPEGLTATGPDKLGWGLRFEQALTLLILFMMSDALIGPLLDPNQAGGDDNPWLRAMWLPIYGLTAGLAAIRWRAMARAWGPIISIGLLILLSWASASWSIAPEVTSRRVMALVFTSLFGLYLGARWSWTEFVNLVAILGFGLALGSYGVCIGYPVMGVHHEVNAGDWRGLWFEKNALGAMMAVSVLASVSTALARPTQRLWWSLNAGLCLALVIMSRSGTALITIGLIFGATAALALLRRGSVLRVLTVFGVGAAVFGAVAAQLLAPGMFLALLGKDATLTGRTDIWAAILRQAATHPWLGFGYAAFWEKTSAPAAFVRAQTGWMVPSAHNGWLDVLVQLGAVGVALCAIVMAAGYILALMRALDDRDGNWALIYLSIFLITSFSESVLLERNSLPWALCVATLTKILTERRASRADLAPPGAYAAPAHSLWPPETLG